jgi:hypothetical protein
MALGKPAVLALIGRMKPGEKGSSEGGGEDSDGRATGLQETGREVMDALESGDVEGFTDALQSFVLQCSEPGE